MPCPSRATRRLRLLIPATVLALAAAAHAGEGSARGPFNAGGNPALHAVQDERLRGLMHQMQALMFERVPTELELDRERRVTAGTIAEVAGEMAVAVDGILASLPRLSLAQDEEQVFLVLAEKLRVQAGVLVEQASHGQVDLIPATVDQMGATCDGCHQLFRAPVRP